MLSKTVKYTTLPRSNYSTVRLIFWANKCANVQKKFNTKKAVSKSTKLGLYSSEYWLWDLWDASLFPDYGISLWALSPYIYCLLLLMIVSVLYCPYCWEIPEATLRQTNHYRICNNESRSMLACTSKSAFKNCKIYNITKIQSQCCAINFLGQ